MSDAEEIEEQLTDVEVMNGDRVVFTDSDYSRPNWKGFTFEVEEVENMKGVTQRVLALDQISMRTPNDGFVITEDQAMKEYQTDEPPVQIAVSVDDIIKDMESNNPDISIDTSASEEKIFAQVVLEMSNIWNGKYSRKIPSTRDMAKEAGVSWNTARKFLHVAQTAGLFVPANRGKIIRKPPKLEPEALKTIQVFDDWKKEEPIKDWMRKNKTARKTENQITLWNAMEIMQVSPLSLKAMAQKPDKAKAIDEIGLLLEKPRFRDPRSEYNILPKKFMDAGWKLPKKWITGTKNTKGAWYWLQFGLEGKPKVWYYKTPDADPNEYANKKWSLREWSKSPDAPDMWGFDTEVVLRRKGKDLKASPVWRGTPRSLTKGAIEREDENIFYNFVGVIRQFLDTMGLGIGKVEAGSVWSQIANIGRSATIHLTVDQIEGMKDCLADGMKGNIMEFDDYYNFITKREKKITFKDVEESKSYWKDAYFYFLMSLELGFRAEEAFTIVGEKTEPVESTDKSGKSGVIVWDNGDVKVQIYTRKGSLGKKGQKIHGGFIISDETKSLIKDRMREIDEGMDAKDPEKYGVQQYFEGQVYTENSLIGATGRYTEIGTLDLPASEYGEKGKGIVKAVRGNREKIRQMLRHCFHFVRLKEPYWYEHSLHSLRHVFAQYWLELSDYNYGFVATIGHWKTESIVKEVYGKEQGSHILFTMKKFATGDPMEALRQKQIDREKLPSQAEQVVIEQTYHSTEKDLEMEDLKLRQKIFFEGGDYYDVRLNPKERKDTQKYYPAGTDIGLTPKAKLKSLYKMQTASDKTGVTEIEAGG